MIINPWAFYDLEDIPSLCPIKASSEFKKMKFGKTIKICLIILCIISGLSTPLSLVLLLGSKWWFGIICSAMACLFLGSLVAIIDPPFGEEAKENWKKGCSIHPIVYILAIPFIFGSFTIITGINKDILGPMINWVTITGISISVSAIIAFIVVEIIQNKRWESYKSKK